MRHLEVSGTPLERGQQQGEAWKKEIRDLAKVRTGLLEVSFKNIGIKKLDEIILKHIEVLKKDSELWDEFRGISQAAKITERNLMILNNHTDLRDFADVRGNTGECSSFAVKGKDGFLAGQTWDMHASACPFVAHLTVKKPNVTQQIFTLTGCVGLTGVNSYGVGVFINNLRSKEIAFGLAWPMVVRKILDQKNLVDAVETIKNNMPSAGRNFLLATNSEAVCIEVTGKKLKSCGDLSPGFLVHTNHYLSELKYTEDPLTRSKTSVVRYNYLIRALPKVATKHSELMAFAKDLLESDVISIPHNSNDPHGSATCGGMVYDFSEERGISFAGLFSNGDEFIF